MLSAPHRRGGHSQQDPQSSSGKFFQSCLDTVMIDMTLSQCIESTKKSLQHAVEGVLCKVITCQASQKELK